MINHKIYPLYALFMCLVGFYDIRDGAYWATAAALVSAALINVAFILSNYRRTRGAR